MFATQTASGTAAACSGDGSESEALRILIQFERIYLARLVEVNDDPELTDDQRTQAKLKIMEDWVKDLGEQNVMLVQSVHDLEQAAAGRVKLLENKLQETSNLMSYNMSHSNQSEDDLNALSDRVQKLVSDKEATEDTIECLKSDLGNLLELIKRGRTENNWSLDGITFYEIQPSDIPEPDDCTCDQIASMNDKEIQLIKSLETDLNKYRAKLHDLQIELNERCKENESLSACLARVEKEASETRDALTQEVAQKHDVIVNLKSQMQILEEKLQQSDGAVVYKSEIIQTLQHDLSRLKSLNSTRKVRISDEPCVSFEDKTVENQLHETAKQLEECVSKLLLKDNEITKLKTMLNQKSNQVEYAQEEALSSNISIEKQGEILDYLTNLLAAMIEEKNTILDIKTDYETAITGLVHTKSMYEKDIALVHERFQDIEVCLNDYRKEVIEKDQPIDIKEFISSITNKVTYIQKLFQNKCEMCIKEDILLGSTEIISKMKFGIETLSKLYESKCKQAGSLRTTITRNRVMCNKNSEREKEQEAILASILQQFRMMEEFRICTVEVQAATEDLREEISEVLSNLNSRHCKYIELTTLVNEVQDYLTKTRENITEVINQLQLQDEERARHTERIINNRIRLKDIKNEFNQTQSEFSKCLSSVQNNIQLTNFLGHSKIHLCNDLLVSVIEEVEQIVSNVHKFQTQRQCTLSTVMDLKEQLKLMEYKVKELKKKSDQVLLDNEAAQKSFSERSKRLEKYECEVDNCHTKMQDTLDSIIETRQQMNEFGCIKDTDDSFQNTNETIKLKDDLRKLQKECEELKINLSQESNKSTHEEKTSEWENKILDLQDQIKMLQSGIKSKQEANIFLKESIELLEKELNSAHAKVQDYRRCWSTECLEYKKKILELESSLRIQTSTGNDLKCLTSNETDSKKSQLFDIFNKNRDCDGAIKQGLQGSYENIPQLFKVLQDTIHAITDGLQGVSDELKRLVSEGSSYKYHSYDSVRTAIETLAKHIESIKQCSIEVDKIKGALYSKNKLMENMDEIIRIQKDSITISQSEVENLHKTLQEKVDAQEQALSQCEEERQQLIKQVELQVQTIGHLQEAVVEAKRTVDQLTSKAASDNSNKSQIIRSLNIYLTETESQYNDCFDEAYEQGTLLELQREAISNLQKKISFLECDEFLNAFTLHFVYYVILFKYQEEVQLQKKKLINMKSQIDKLEREKSCFEQRCKKFECECQKANDDLKRMRTSYDDAQKLSSGKQREIELLGLKNDDLKKQLNTYKLDFDLIEEEMKKMGMTDSCRKNFKTELETMRSENKQFRDKIEEYETKISKLRASKQVLVDRLHKVERNFQKCQEEFTNQNEMIGKLRHQNHYYEKIHTCHKKEILKLKEKNQDLMNRNETLVLKNRMDQNLCLLQRESELKKNDDKSQEVSQNLARRCNLKTEHYPDWHHFPNHCDYPHPHCKRKEDKRDVEIKELTTNIEELQNELSSKNTALSRVECKLSETETKFKTLSAKHETSERSLQRQKDEIMLLEKKVACLTQKQQICLEKNHDLLRQNKALEEHNDKCMAELEDIAQQLDDLQTALNELRAECDAKSRSLDCVSVELARMKVSRTEVCQESKHVLEWVRIWMREQKHVTGRLLERLRAKQQQLLRLSAERKKLKRQSKVLARRRRKMSAVKQTTAALVLNGSAGEFQRMYKYSAKRRGTVLENGFHSSRSRQESKAFFSYFTRECKEGPNRTISEIKSKGNKKFIPSLQYFSKQLPETPADIVPVERKTSEDTVDNGYQTSSSK